jgi:hypothetical protein
MPAPTGENRRIAFILSRKTRASPHERAALTRIEEHDDVSNEDIALLKRLRSGCADKLTHHWREQTKRTP